MNYANQLCQVFLNLKVQVQFAAYCAMHEASSMAYGFRELSKQKKVAVLGQSQAMNSYPLNDIISLVTVGDKGNADLFSKQCHSKFL